MKHIIYIRQLWSCVLLLLFSLTTGVVAQTNPPAWQQKLTLPNLILDPLQQGQERVAVIVTLVPNARARQKTDWNAPQSLQTLRAANRADSTAVLQRLAAHEHRVRHQFDNHAGFSCELTAAALERLANDPRVASIEPVLELQMHLNQGIPLMNALATRSTYNGTNIAIAICDTGIDYTHPRLGGGGFPNSKVIGGYDFGNNDANPMPVGEAHGTACAGIAAGNLGTVGDYIGGVAPGAKLYALKISPNNSGSATLDAMVAAWDWCVTHKNDDPNNPILVISTSFGGFQFFGACDGYSPGMTAAANNAVEAGITVLASAGNDGYCNSMAWPACISSVISVGATYDANFGNYTPCVSAASCANKISTPQCTGYYVNDSTAPNKVTAYSNTAPFLDIFAPANQCYTADMVGTGGYNTSTTANGGDYYSGFGGTSAACPYAAGAVAALQHAAKVLTGNYLTPAEVRSRLASSGTPTTDTKVAITKPRVNLGSAISDLIMSVTPATDLMVTGTVGDAFSSSCESYTLTNQSVSAFNWTATKTAAWLDVTPASGSLAASNNVIINVCFNTAANALGAGVYTDTVTFSNLTKGVTLTRAVSLEISSPRLYYFDLDTDPGWSRQGQWAFGQPTGNGGTLNGAPDPTAGATGTNVFGVNLAGDYSTTESGPHYLTAGPFDFTGHTNVVLRFQRWLNTDYQPYVSATLQVSSNGTTWSQIWSNGPSVVIIAASWSRVNHSLNALAANRNNVSIRWGYQIATQAFAYSGWNIDDIELLADPLPPSITGQPEPQNVCSNGVAQFSVTATGANLGYQWQKDGADLSGATTNPLTVYPITAAEVAAYRCIVSNTGGSITSSVATLALLPATTLTGQPTSQTICAGATAQFSVTATGAGLLTYQWEKAGTPLTEAGHYSGTASNVLTVAPTDAGDTAAYRCIVTAECGSRTSDVATLTVDFPALVIGPVSQDVGIIATGLLVQTSFTVSNAGCGLLTGTLDVGGTFNVAGNSATQMMVALSTALEGAFTNLIVVTSNGGDSTNSVTGHGAIPPVAAFAASFTNGLAPLEVEFTDLSTGTITNRFWDFGDATTNLLATTITHTFSGTNDVLLIVTGPLGVSTSAVVTIIATNIIPTADLAITQFASANPVTLGDMLTFSLVISNFGGAAATSVTITDTLPAGVTFITASPGCVTNGNLIICDLATLASNAAATVSFTVVPTLPGLLMNTAIVSASEPDPNLADNNSTSEVTVPVDADNDGIPDTWELVHGLDPHNTTDAARDDDGDGFTNLQEYHTGTNPHDAASAFRITSVTPVSNDVLIIWLAGAGTTNIVQSTGAFPSNFLDISSPFIIPAGGDVLTNHLDQGGVTNTPSRYYRIRLQ